MSVKRNNAGSKKTIVVKGAREHNLKNVDLELPRNKLVVFTGVSGSGKSSLVFDTIYAEGQRRYVESMSSYARQFLERVGKPDVDAMHGVSPAVAIEQKTGSHNPRSTVGTATELYDHLRLLFARLGKTLCFDCGSVVKRSTVGDVADWLDEREDGSKWYLAFPMPDHEGRSVRDELDYLKKRGFFRVYYNGEYKEIDDLARAPRTKDKARPVVKRFKAKPGSSREDLADSIETAFREGEGRLVLVNADTGEEKEFAQFYECCGITYEEPEPRFFSFNNPYGACPVCQGFGRTMGIDIDLVAPDQSLSIREGAIAPWRTQKYAGHLRNLIKFAKSRGIPVDKPFRELTDEQIEAIRSGGEGYVGIDKFFKAMESKTYKMHIRVYLSKYRGYSRCHACKGSRLRREALQVRVGELSIHDVVMMPIERALEWANELETTDYERKVGERIIKELRKRLSFLNDVGLGYLTLDRLSSTLSGGETQRINLATALGSSLVGALYVLDEPTIGLHPRDNARLIDILKRLRDIGNTTLVVEHDPEMMREADLIVDIGPGAGERGGEIVAVGTPEELAKCKNSVTGQYLARKKTIPIRRETKSRTRKSIKIRGAREHNLKMIDATIPLNRFVVVTGVSGSGKSTLVRNVLYGAVAAELGLNPKSIGKHRSIEGVENLDHVEIVDQSPIGKSPRSNPISYIKAFEIIREVFADTPQAKTKGYKPGYFSFNVAGGRCETCQGEGYIKVDMQFLADVYLECEDCKGTRYKRETREIEYRGKNIVDVLNMTADEALEFFKSKRKLHVALQTLSDVGLGYIRLGQASNTLSGGEAQRVKLAAHMLARREGQRGLFIFDEPTTGLHFDDVSKLLDCFQMLIDGGNSVVVIEHNLDVIKCADYVVDLGPEAGFRGGDLVVAGTPEQVMKCEKSWTGKYLKEYLGSIGQR